jgi:hypothetical protein
MTRRAFWGAILGCLLMSSTAWALPIACGHGARAKHHVLQSSLGCSFQQDPWQDCDEDPWQLGGSATLRAALANRFTDPWQDVGDPWQPFAPARLARPGKDTGVDPWQPPASVAVLAVPALELFEDPWQPDVLDPWQDRVQYLDEDPWQ